MKHTLFASLGAIALASAMTEAGAVVVMEPTDTLYVPARSVVLSGTPSTDLIGLVYSRNDMYVDDPGAPRFLFFDKQGRVAVGIGGRIKGTLHYDFDGSVDGPGLVTYEIPVPADPAQRQAFGGDISHSSVFLKLVGRTTRFGYYSAYFEMNFTGDGPGKYGVKLKKAYMTLGALTAGYNNSTFIDAASGLPTIEEQGPCGALSATQLLFRYNPRIDSHWSAAIAAEIGTVDVTADAQCRSISQRVPDIPAYIQYRWDGGNSHIRLSGLLRTMSYRNLATNKNRFCNGWGVQLSGMVALPADFSFLYQGAYGAGIAAYVNDLAGYGLDMVYAADGSGRMTAPHSTALQGGFLYDNGRFSASAAYGYVRLYNQSQLGASAYKHANYVSLTAYYNILPDLQTGLEYVWGQRKDMGGDTGHANRISALLQYSF